MIPLLALSGCAQPWQGFQTGQSDSALIARLGPPHEVYLLPDGGKRLMWPTQPMGEVTTAADVDRMSRIVSVRQVLQRDGFSRAEIGKWTRHDVLISFGQPEDKAYFPLTQREVWTYRFKDGPWYQLYHFYFDNEGVLRLTQNSMDLLNDQSPHDAF
ncbi:hypothetical protein G3A43_40865 [Paraburkholderia aspalathi]|nr:MULTISPECIES: hypothetical protein [Paraburkholderia]MBK3786556.1 hypothetical protein [Paraburkholderia aspalathi]